LTGQLTNVMQGEVADRVAGAGTLPPEVYSYLRRKFSFSRATPCATDVRENGCRDIDKLISIEKKIK
jgi:hypothetical protein